MIYYNDGRHSSVYRFDPPMSLQRLRRPVDEILGTGVRVLSFGLSTGQTFLHDTKVGFRIGEGANVHRSGLVWWRASANCQDAVERDLDPLRVVVDRAHQKGLRILCSLRMNSPGGPDDYYGTSRLKREHPEIVIGEKAPAGSMAATCADFARRDVRQERLDVIEEVCGRYGADGFEFDPYVNIFFAPDEARKNAAILTDFMGEIRDLLDRIGREQNRKLTLAVRADVDPDTNLEAGMDVRTWIEQGFVDLVVALPKGVLILDEMPIDWLLDAARAKGNVKVHASLGRANLLVYDDRRHDVTIEMFRAAATNYYAMGVDGLYLSNLPWPLSAREYEILREMSDPDIFARKNKLYFLPRREPRTDGYVARRVLPAVLEEGAAVSASLEVRDRLGEARDDGELDRQTLGVRIVQTCPEDELSFRLNGQAVQPSRVTHYYGGTVAYFPVKVGMDERIDTHYWFWFELPLDIVREGANTVEVELVRRFAPLTTDRVLHQIELQVDYRQPPHPRGGQM
jgi:hypothetical protein